MRSQLVTPKVEFFLEERSTNMGRIMEFAGSVVVEYLGEDSWMAVEEVLVEQWVVINQRFSQT